MAPGVQRPPPRDGPPPERGGIRGFLGHLGAGIIAGASDNDPTTVATLAIIGATTIYDLTWLVLLILPMLLVIQVISARLGLVTRTNLIVAIRDRFGATWALIAMSTILIVNLVTIGADLAGGAAALEIITGLPWQLFVLPLVILIALVLMFSSYGQVSRILRYLALVFVAYVLAAFLARPDWLVVLRHTVIPTFEVSPHYLEASLALLGTTITSYVFVWETIEEEEERRPLQQLRMVELDAAIGIVMAVILFWFIVVATGTTLGINHQTVETAQDAARALTPVAGPLAGLIFALGLLASALLAVPVLTATSAYVMASVFCWRSSLNEPVNAETRHFYAVLVGSLALGAALTILGIEPIQLLFLAGIVGGLGTPLLLVLLLLLVQSPTVMEGHQISGPLAVIGWITVMIIGFAGVMFLII